MSALKVRSAMNSIFSSCSGSICVTVDQDQQPGRLSNHSCRMVSTANSTDRDMALRSSRNVVLVALDASCSSSGSGSDGIVIQDHALRWAARNVVRTGDWLCLVVLYDHRPQRQGSIGRKLWQCDGGSDELVGCGHRHSRPRHQSGSPVEERIKESCSFMASKLCDTSKINIKVKTVPRSGSSRGIVAGEAIKLRASWVVLERSLHKEGRWCARGSRSNVVLVGHGGFRVLCLNLKSAAAAPAAAIDSSSSSSSVLLGLPSSKRRVIFSGAGAAGDHSVEGNESSGSSPEIETPFSVTERGSSSSSSTSSSEHDRPSQTKKQAIDASSSGTKDCLDERLVFQARSVLSDADNFLKTKQQQDRAATPDIVTNFSALQIHGKSPRTNSARHISQRSFESLFPIQEAPSVSDQQQQRDVKNPTHPLERTSSVRNAVALPLKRTLAGSPPLCSICQHASPVFGRPPRRFSYGELEFATGGFSKANFLAEGGYGSVHRGVLRDGIPVAVKQYKLASSQGDLEFCSEVEVLSCAQHRNVVMLIGYCIEKKRRLLVYEFICNGSLDSHIYGGSKPALKWSSRHKIAVGAARGLRYLHEECRVGCIVHRDMRPNNILLTHDFEPMVGDFGLARWQPDGDLGVETRVIGTFGYLAPEYAQTGHITEKADVYSFGVVLLELVTGRKAIDISRPRGQQCLTEWARPLLEDNAHHELIDPAIATELNQYEAYCALVAASLCVQRDPHSRPRMSQVLRMLEGDLNLSRNSSPMRSRLSCYSPHSSTKNSIARSSSPSRSKLPAASSSDKAAAIDTLNISVSSYMSAHPIVVCNTKLSHEALKAAYKDKLDSSSSRPSLDD